MFKSQLDWLKIVLNLLKNIISLIEELPDFRWWFAVFRPIKGFFGLLVGRDLYHDAPAVTEDFGFFGLICRAVPICSPLYYKHGKLLRDLFSWESLRDYVNSIIPVLEMEYYDIQLCSTIVTNNWAVFMSSYRIKCGLEEKAKLLRGSS